VYDTIIPRTVRLSEAPGFGQPITVYDPRSSGAKRYRELAGEVAQKEPADEPVPVMDSLPSVILPPIEPVPMTAPRPLPERPDKPTAPVSSETGGDGNALADWAAEEVPDEGEARELKMVGGWAGGETTREEGSAVDSVEAVGQVGGPVHTTAAGGRGSVDTKAAPPAKPEVKVQPRPAVDETPTDQPFEEPIEEHPSEVNPAEHERAGLEPAQRRLAEHPPEEPSERPQERARADGRAGEQDMESSPEDEDQKRRWSLFRRGGKG
jgi:hypothetical protein